MRVLGQLNLTHPPPMQIRSPPGSMRVVGLRTPFWQALWDATADHLFRRPRRL